MRHLFVFLLGMSLFLLACEGDSIKPKLNCDDGWAVCKGSDDCVKLDTKAHCGSCEISCRDNEECDAGECKEIEEVLLCGGKRCNKDEICLEDLCTPTVNELCGGEQCQKSEVCVADVCVNKDDVLCGGISCDSDQKCVDERCIPYDAILCADEVCAAGSSCVDGECRCGETKCEASETCRDGLCLCGSFFCENDDVCKNGICVCGDAPCGQHSYCASEACLCEEGYSDCNSDMSDGCETWGECVCVPGLDRAWCIEVNGEMKHIKIPAELSGADEATLLAEGSKAFGGVHGPCRVGIANCSSGMGFGTCEGAVNPLRRVTCDDNGQPIVEDGVDLTTVDAMCRGYADGCLTNCDMLIEADSYIGCEYWTAYMDNSSAHRNNFTLVISNTQALDDPNDPVEIAEKTAHIKIFADPKPLAETAEVPPNSVKELLLYDGKTNMVLGDGVNKASIRVLSTQPVTVYQFNPMGLANAYSNDASLLLPSNVLGREYVSINTNNTLGSHIGGGEIVVINASPSENKIRIRYANEPDTAEGRMFTLKPSEIYRGSGLNSYGSSTGVQVTSELPVGVLTGVRCLNTGPCCCDHIEEYLFPVRTWGTHYHAVRTKQLGKELMYWSVVAAKNDTFVGFSDGMASFSKKLMARESLFIKSGENFEIASYAVDAENQKIEGEAKPILVALTMPSSGETGQTSALGGDPALMLIVPMEQYRKNYAFSVPSSYTKDWVTVVAPMGTELKLDGELVEQPLTGFGTKDANDEFRFGYAYLEMLPGAHTLVADKEIGAYGNGINKDVSYAYPLGLNLKVINKEEHEIVN